MTGFDRVDVAVKLGETEYSAVKFTITALGNEEQLTGMLELLKEFPSATVRTLNFVRPQTSAEDARSGNWQMTLNIDVIYR